MNDTTYRCSKERKCKNETKDKQKQKVMSAINKQKGKTDTETETEKQESEKEKKKREKEPEISSTSSPFPGSVSHSEQMERGLVCIESIPHVTKTTASLLAADQRARRQSRLLIGPASPILIGRPIYSDLTHCAVC